MREHFPNSSREREGGEGGNRSEREGRAEELREGICIVSSSESSKWCLLFNLFLFSRGGVEQEEGEEEPGRGAQI